jgi:hypothetical protein
MRARRQDDARPQPACGHRADRERRRQGALHVNRFGGPLAFVFAVSFLPV